MLSSLKEILEIQEFDIKMIQLILLKRERRKELNLIHANQESLRQKIADQNGVILEIKKLIRLMEGEHSEIQTKIKKLEAQQYAIKKVDEYNAIMHEISAADRERLSKELRLSDFYDRLNNEEELQKKLQSTLDTAIESSLAVENEINESILQINAEGRSLKSARDELVKNVDSTIFATYERLLNNKKNRVVVPLENRCCSGCHIMLTAQHENLVRKGERIVFCEHCSRIHYWQESKGLEDSVIATKQRRRRTVK